MRHLLDGSAGPNQTAAALDQVAAGADQTGRLLDDLLALAEIQEGRLSLHAAPADLQAVAREAVESGRGGEVTVQVLDEGPAILDANHEPLFEPLATSRVIARARTGGVGLPLARQLARIMGGDLTVRNGPGGATFTLRLPPRAPGDRLGD